MRNNKTKQNSVIGKEYEQIEYCLIYETIYIIEYTFRYINGSIYAIFSHCINYVVSIDKKAV